MPLLQAIVAIVRNFPGHFRDTACHQSVVYTGLGVSLPTKIEFDLSAGLKHMFHQPHSTKLIEDTYSDFIRHLRWKIKFTLEGKNKTYDPDYDVSRPSEAEPPVLPYYCELAIQHRHEYLLKQISKIPQDGLVDDTFKLLSPKASTIHKFLVEYDFVVTLTDKNLGLAVSEWTWIMDNTLACLANECEYKCLTEIEAQQVLDRICNTMTLLSQCTAVFNWKYGQISDFLCPLLPHPGPITIFCASMEFQRSIKCQSNLD